MKDWEGERATDGGGQEQGDQGYMGINRLQRLIEDRRSRRSWISSMGRRGRRSRRGRRRRRCKRCRKRSTSQLTSSRAEWKKSERKLLTLRRKQGLETQEKRRIRNSGLRTQY